eukprot:scaffold2372_cov198-Alexandrium_tamarense.AAC.29
MPIEMREREYLMLDVSSSLTSVEDGAGYNCLRPDLTTYFNFGVKQKILVHRNYTFDFSSLKTVLQRNWYNQLQWSRLFLTISEKISVKARMKR